MSAESAASPSDDGSPASSGGGGRFALFREPIFVRIWFAGFCGGTIRWLETLAVAIYTFHLTGSPFLVTLMLFARAVPSMLFGAPLGALAARLERRRLMLWGYAILTAMSTTLCLLAFTGYLELWHIGLGAVLSGCGWAMDHPVRRTLLGEVAGNTRLGVAMSLDSATNHLTRAIGPIFGGVLLYLLGISGVYAIAIAFNGAVFLAMFGVEHRETHTAVRADPSVRFLHTLAEGIAFARTNPLTIGVLIITVLVNLFGFSYTSIAPVIGEEVLGLDAPQIGLLMSAEGSGAFLGSVILAALVRPAWYRLIFTSGALCFFAMVVVFSFSTDFALSSSVLLVSGIGIAGFSAMQSTLLMHSAPPAMRSRMMGLLAFCIGTAPLGILLVGTLSEWLGPARALTVLSVSGFALLVLTLFVRPELRGAAPPEILSPVPRASDDEAAANERDRNMEADRGEPGEHGEMQRETLDRAAGGERAHDRDRMR